MRSTYLTYDEMTDEQRRAVIEAVMSAAERGVAFNYDPGSWGVVKAVLRPKIPTFKVELRAVQPGDTFWNHTTNNWDRASCLSLSLTRLVQVEVL